MGAINRQAQQAAAALGTLGRFRYLLPVFLVFMGTMYIYLYRDDGTRFGFGNVMGGACIVLGLIVGAFVAKHRWKG